MPVITKLSRLTVSKVLGVTLVAVTVAVLSGGVTHAAESNQQQLIRLPAFGNQPTPTPAQTPTAQRPVPVQRQTVAAPSSQPDSQTVPAPAASATAAAVVQTTPTPSPTETPSQAGLVAGSEVMYGSGFDRMTTGWLILAASGLVLSGVVLIFIGQRRMAAIRALRAP